MRPLSIWTTYFLCLALVLGSLAWFAHRVIILEREQWQSIAEEHAAELQQRALWRMEYAIGPLLIQEARPYYDFAAYHIGDRPAPTQLPRKEHTENVAPSSVIGGSAGFVKMHFQYGVDERVTSPQVPEGDLEALAYLRGDTTKEGVALAREALARLEKAVRYFSIKRMVINLERAEQNAPDKTGLVGELPLLERTSAEWRARARQLENNERQNGVGQRPSVTKGSPNVSSGSMRALWCGDFLVLARHVVVDGEPMVQGCWLDRTPIEERLIADIRNLLPSARLVPRDVEKPLEEDDRGLALVSLPYRLVPGEIPIRRGEAGSAARTSLYVAIACALFAAFAVGFVLKIQLATSERRAEFVSAVTHELRTPLTTLRMYADLLADGRVKRDRQPTYFATLKREADRLTSLVENVLSYSRVESNRKTPRSEPITLDDLLHRVIERSNERATRAGMQLTVATEDPGLRVAADPAAVEQIVFNLVDNACKYASDAPDKRIEVRAVGTARGGAIIVRDFGPGIDERAAKKLFQPFARPDRAETSSKPGVGLGLALCRKLARSMRGDLRFDGEGGPGANFRLELMRA